MKTFKIALTTAPILKIADYKEEAEKIIYVINISSEKQRDMLI